MEQQNAENAAVGRTQIIDLFPVSSFNVAADSHVGLVRENNEDSYAYCVNHKHRTALLLVADGIGGNAGGEIASRFTAQSVISHWRKLTQDKTPSADWTGRFMISILNEINKKLYNTNVEQENLTAPMGTTVAAIALVPNYVVIANAGDSRVYRIRDGQIEQLTEDHSLVQKFINEGKMTPEEAEESPVSHVIYKSIGVQEELYPDVRIEDRKNGDRFIICSDGLTGHLRDKEILQVVENSPDAKSVIRTLISGALRGGGKDNVTVLCYYQQ